MLFAEPRDPFAFPGDTSVVDVVTVGGMTNDSVDASCCNVAAV